MADNHTNILLENIEHQNKLVLDAVADIRTKVDKLPTRGELNELKQDVKAIKLSVGATNEQGRDHEQRITHLEAKV